MERLLSRLEDVSCTCSHRLSYTSAAKCFAALLNKRPQGNCDPAPLPSSIPRQISRDLFGFFR